jgi:hypothetical protein
MFQLCNKYGGFMDNHTNIDLKKLLASAALEDEELSMKLKK